jgi:hypothetical protein
VLFLINALFTLYDAPRHASLSRFDFFKRITRLLVSRESMETQHRSDSTSNGPSATRSNGVIRVPASTANLGPGFDALGAALRVHLKVSFAINGTSQITIHSTSPSIPTNPAQNLITRVSIFVANCHGKPLPGMDITIDNPVLASY